MSAGDGGQKIIIVKKKAKGHGGHHGGSWKVAYADFVTAMMAFFLVMWILGMDQGVKDLVQGYFNNPVGFKRAFSGGSTVVSAGNHPSNMGLQQNSLMARETQTRQFRETADLIEEELGEAGLGTSFQADVEILVTEEGLRIELMETGEGETFFEKSSADLKPLLSSVLGVIAQGLSPLPNDVVVEGHTDALRFGTRGYSNWELSGDRANAARRVMEANGLGEDRVAEVRGYADRKLKVADDPLDPRNRRITLLLPFKEEIILEFLPTSALGGSEALPVAMGNRGGGSKP